MENSSILKLWLLTVVLGSLLIGILSLFIGEFNELKSIAIFF